MAELHALQPMPVTLATLAEDQLARVRLGPIPDPTTAYSTLDRLKRSGFSEAFIIAPKKSLPQLLMPTKRQPGCQSAQKTGEMMSHKQPRLRTVVLSLLPVLLVGGLARAQAFETPAHAAILMDLQSGRSCMPRTPTWRCRRPR